MLTPDTYFSGRLQLTKFENGRPFNFRSPTEQEIDETLGNLAQDDFRQDYGQKTNYSRLRHLKSIARYRVKQIVFYLRGRLQRDPLNVHYAMTPYIVERRNFRDFPSNDHFSANWKEHAGDSKLPALYIPLSYFPESTIDYWIINKSIIDYENKMAEIIGTLGRSYTLFVKEHPHMLGARSPKFYDRLGSLPNVVMVPPLEFSQAVLKKSVGIVIGAGSGGVEAVLRDTPVFTFSEISYWFEKSQSTYIDLDQIETWPDTINKALRKYRPLDASLKRAFVASCLMSTARSRSGGARWALIDESDLLQLLKKGIATRGN